jgi:hypothetical protein
MGIELIVNAAPSPYSKQVAAAVMAALGRRPEAEQWAVAILEGEPGGCVVSIDRPDGGRSRWSFARCGDDVIKDTIRQDLRREGYSWL